MRRSRNWDLKEWYPSRSFKAKAEAAEKAPPPELSKPKKEQWKTSCRQIDHMLGPLIQVAWALWVFGHFA